MRPGDKIKYLRKSLNLTQEEFAKSLGVEQAYISQIENNQRKPSFEVLQKLYEVYNISADYILQDKIENPYPAASKVSEPREEYGIGVITEGNMPIAFIERLKEDIENITAKEAFYASLETPRETVEKALKGKCILSRRSVIELAMALKQPVFEYLTLADYIPDEIKKVVKRESVIKMFKKLVKLSPEEIDEVMDAISKLLKPYTKTTS
jgi:transcriptional regulator with XRE-family HTH domain